jgi:hypothetical protein
VPTLHFTEASAFGLPPSGEGRALFLLTEVIIPHDRHSLEEVWDVLFLGGLLPHFNRSGRELLWGKQLIKQFRQPAHNQELVLLTAEELQGPDWFDDPLPRRKGECSKVQLHDTIKDLNRRQRLPLTDRACDAGINDRLYFCSSFEALWSFPASCLGWGR